MTKLMRRGRRCDFSYTSRDGSGFGALWPVGKLNVYRAGMKKSFSAFTLIELLVVIALVSILSAILFPVLGRARENSRRTSCLQNLKQITLAVKQYTIDFDGRFPLDVVSGTAGTAPFGWADAMLIYTQSAQVFQCPNDTRAAPTAPDQPNYSDYFYNLALARGRGGDVSMRTGARESQLDFPSRTLAFGCMDNARKVSGRAFVTDGGGAGQGLADSSTPGWNKHLEGTTLAFADGHVKWFKGAPGPNHSLKVFRAHHPFATRADVAGWNVSGSGGNPTFHVSDGITRQPLPGPN